MPENHAVTIQFPGHAPIETDTATMKKAARRLSKPGKGRAGGRASKATDAAAARSGGIAADQLRSFIERIERLEEEKKGVAADIREVYAEAKGSGFDPKIMRECIRKRRMDPADRAAFEALLDTYQHALAL
jgi:uncharacterized protein (UPF0335 family)